MERLTAEDQLMLWPDELWPQDIGALVVLDGGPLLDGAGHFRIEAVRQAVAARLHLVPRFRQLLVVPPRRLGGPLWVDAPEVDLAEHVSAVRVPPPGDEEQVLLVVERLRRHRLDRSRPLWEMWFLTGLPNNQVGLFVRMHHTIADGMAGVATIATFLDTTPDTGPTTPPPWAPRAAPTAAQLHDDEHRRRRQRLRDALSRLAQPLATLRAVRGAWPGARELLAEPPGPATSLNRVVGPDRTIALIRASLHDVKEIGHAFGATVNDVLLAMTAGGLRELLVSRGESDAVTGLRIYVPVSLHDDQQGQARGNLIAQMVVPLHSAVADPVARLRLIAGETVRRKGVARPSLGKAPRRGVAGRVFLSLVSRQRVNVASADIPGPDVPLYFAGARLLEVFAMVQLIGTVSLAVGAMSYAGQFNIMVIADRDSYPDIDVFTRATRDELRALSAAARTRSPGSPHAAEELEDPLKQQVGGRRVV